jgi:alkanesulfonate monooxygenase SsuD/methylene tetrahydromethanopterin reductase-like flavin-dependent oxidoreductase (luciferase family)
MGKSDDKHLGSGVRDSPNRLKLGTFATNASHAGSMTSVEGHFETTWDSVSELAAIADGAGMEAIVSVGRWRGHGGDVDFNGSSYETFTWAAGIGAETKTASVFATCHMPTIHPIRAAKQAVTVDHISRGRFAINLVCGWYRSEMEMFGAPLMEHDLRYDYAEEWIEIVKRLWTSDEEVNFRGKFFTIKNAVSQPKPIQVPLPPIMQAGGSPRGRDFAAKHADLAFLGLRPDLVGAAEEIASLRALARDKYGREIQTWSTCYGVIGDTDDEAERFLRYYVEEKGDWKSADNFLAEAGLNTGSLGAHGLTPADFESLRYHFVAGVGGFPLVGTPETITRRISQVVDVGIDGVLLVFARYRQDLGRFVDEVIPLLCRSGLRESGSSVVKGIGHMPGDGQHLDMAIGDGLREPLA